MTKAVRREVGEVLTAGQRSKRRGQDARPGIRGRLRRRNQPQLRLPRFRRRIARVIGAAGLTTVLLLTAWIGADIDPAVAAPERIQPSLDEPNATTTSEADGLWYFTETQLADIHASGITGQGVTIAIIDSPINLEVADLADADIRPRTEEVCPGFTGIEISERARHGTAMASLIVGNGKGVGAEPGVLGVAPDATILHYAVLNVAVDECAAPLADLVADAIEQGADILNLSISYNSPMDAQNAIDLALEAGLVVNVAVQNESSDSLDLLSGLPGVVSVENVDQDGQPDAYSVTGDGLDFIAPGVGIRMLKTDFSGYELDHGTSPATAWVSGVFALAQSAWPDATGNQLIQAAIRSTRTFDVDALPRTDSEGFGFLDPSTFLSTDPTQFPDANPLLDSGETPATDSAVEEHPTDPDDLTGAERPWLTLVSLAAGFLAATGLYVVILLRRRRRHRYWQE
ncbi:S8 family peptidase [Gulosibacter chungangensis]|uniref:S8 family peptidase n=1 Tax=Gulosibacter chungangensis TaxID=979746 RepID=UPI001787AC55|nr:S8 family serine peptidase [Gulosibacter chungangensis]